MLELVRGGRVQVVVSSFSYGAKGGVMGRLGWEFLRRGVVVSTSLSEALALVLAIEFFQKGGGYGVYSLQEYHRQISFLPQGLREGEFMEDRRLHFLFSMEV
ncbi:MAG: hypothetical protein D6805_05655 [Planctomycetota bacterium]|nr:MAG: hypothetical protein D6805_05655 [Planctomycetota bacterium]